MAKSTNLGSIPLRQARKGGLEDRLQVFAHIAANGDEKSFIQLRINPEDKEYQAVQLEQARAKADGNAEKRQALEGDLEEARAKLKQAESELRKARAKLKKLNEAEKKPTKKAMAEAEEGVAAATQQRDMAKATVKGLEAEIESLGDVQDEQKEEQPPARPWAGALNIYDLFSLVRALNDVVTLSESVHRFFDRGTAMTIRGGKSGRRGYTAFVALNRNRDNMRSGYFLSPDQAYRMLQLLRPIFRRLPVQFPVIVSTRSQPKYAEGTFVRVGNTTLVTRVGAETVSLSDADNEWMRFATTAIQRANGHSVSHVTRPGGYAVNLQQGIITLPGMRIRMDRRVLNAASELL